MRRTLLALVAITIGLLTLACSGGGSSLLGPTAYTAASQVTPSDSGIGTLAPPSSAPAGHAAAATLATPAQNQFGLTLDPGELDPPGIE